MNTLLDWKSDILARALMLLGLRRRPRPSQQRYLFAHRALPCLLLETPEEVQRKGCLLDLWLSVGRACGDNQPPDGLEAVAVHRDGWRGVLVTLPEPQRVPEAYFALAVWPESDRRAVRFFTLEQSFGGTVVGEWLREGPHCNYGRGPEPEPQRFLDRVWELIAG